MLTVNKELERRIDSLELRLTKLSTLYETVNRLDEVLDKTAESVNHLTVFMERQEERALMRDKWSKYALGILSIVLPLGLTAVGWYATTLETKIDRVNGKVGEHNSSLVELSTKIDILVDSLN